MTKDSSQTITGHLVYNYTPCIKKVFLRDYSITQYSVRKKDISVMPQQISEKLRSLLIKKGFKITEVEKNYLEGKKEIFEIKIDISKVLDKGEIKQLLVRIHADNVVDLTEKIKIIRDRVKIECNSKPDVQTYQKIERC